MLFHHGTPTATDDLSRYLFGSYQYHNPVPVAGDTVYKDMIFILPVERIVLFICLVRGRMDTEPAVLLRLWIIL